VRPDLELAGGLADNWLQPERWTFSPQGFNPPTLVGGC
jgi:hypothetical protein